MVKAEVLRSDSFILALRFTDAPHHVLNAIRRAIIEEVPTLAIDTVIFVENNSVLHDEALAHRLGLIPFVNSEAVNKYRKPEECMERPEETGCSTKAYLEVKNDNSEEMVVLASHLRVEDPDVKPVYPDIPIIILSRGQRVVLEATLRLGKGKEHIKWSPVSVSTLTYQPIVKYDLTALSEASLRECISCISNYDSKVAEKMAGTLKGELKLDPLKPTSLLRYCSANVCGNNVMVEYLEDELILRFESIGSLTPKEIVFLAIKELKEKLDAFMNELKPIVQTGVKGVSQ